ncbi:HAD family hydrolase [Gaetbulibacter aquiaggeris]|uniref:HAD family hydrolase n=1 Tax=Gaetbulibacter aquiaggeris TaxID=1735373 RepID=A0ABW7MVP8_9FLAO
MIIKNNTMVVVFDLDDTLYQEIDFLKSAFQEISDILSKEVAESAETLYRYMLQCYKTGGDTFQTVIETYGVQKYNLTDLVAIYRNHYPDIALSHDTQDVLNSIKKEAYKVGLITDGRALQQHHKLKALGLQDYFDATVISESFGSSKPDARNYEYYETLFGVTYHYVYVGDNTNKDFIAPNALGWTTVCLKDKGRNIHKQEFKGDDSKQPQFVIRHLSELSSLLFKLPTTS